MHNPGLVAPVCRAHSGHLEFCMHPSAVSPQAPFSMPVFCLSSPTFYRLSRQVGTVYTVILTSTEDRWSSCCVRLTHSAPLKPSRCHQGGQSRLLRLMSTKLWPHPSLPGPCQWHPRRADIEYNPRWAKSWVPLQLVPSDPALLCHRRTPDDFRYPGQSTYGQDRQGTLSRPLILSPHSSLNLLAEDSFLPSILSFRGRSTTGRSFYCAAWKNSN